MDSHDEWLALDMCLITARESRDRAELLKKTKLIPTGAYKVSDMNICICGHPENESLCDKWDCPLLVRW
jgi:hypothetical protein